jgi:hypothetical protein
VSRSTQETDIRPNALSPTGLSPTVADPSRSVRLERLRSDGILQNPTPAPTTPHAQRLQTITRIWFRLLPFRSPLLGECKYCLFSSGYLDVSVPPVPFLTLCVQARMPQYYPRRVSPFGNPRLITLACSSPRLIAAGHVLHRPLAPRHPPCALSSLTFSPTILVNPKARMRTYKLYLYSSFICGCQRAHFTLQRQLPRVMDFQR